MERVFVVGSIFGFTLAVLGLAIATIPYEYKNQVEKKDRICGRIISLIGIIILIPCICFAINIMNRGIPYTESNLINGEVYSTILTTSDPETRRKVDSRN